MIGYCKHNYNVASSILTESCVSILTMENLHKRIREVMDDHGWEPPKVAEICGMKTPHAIYQWLDGTTKNIKLDNLYKFCRAAEIHIEWLITGEEPKHKPEKLRVLEVNYNHLSDRDRDLLWANSVAMAKPTEVKLHNDKQ